MDAVIRGKIDMAIWAARSLFERGKTSGSSANLSFLHDGDIYITGSGTCFGMLKEDSFAVVDRMGNSRPGIKPSKELELHKILYDKIPGTGAVIHTHSTYATLWSCLKHQGMKDVIPAYTPYLGMRVGKVDLVPYASPGSEELFANFRQSVGGSKGYLLQNHGPIVAGSDMLQAFNDIEELEESCRICWQMRGVTDGQMIRP